MNMRDISSLPGVVKPRTAQEIDIQAEALADSGAQGSFADPHNNARHMSVTPGMRIADLGSGVGAYTFALAPLVGELGRVYAVDVQKDLLKKISNIAQNEGHENVEVVWGDIERIGGTKLADASVNIALLSNTLFQVEDRASCFKEAVRILKPGGLLVVIDWTDSFGGMGPPQDMVVTQAQTEELAARAGLEVSREFAAGAHHFGVIYQKPEAASAPPGKTL